MNVPTLMIGLIGAVMAFAILAVLTKKARDYLTSCQDEDRRLRALQEENPQPQKPPEDPTSQPKRAAWWGEQFLSRMSMVGLVLILEELPILLINSYLIAISLEVIFPDPPSILFVINIWGWERIITVFDLYGVLIGLTQIVSGSVCHLTKDNKHSLIYWSSAVALSSLVAFEVSIAFWRGLILEGEINAYLSALLALGIATAEVSVGILVIDYFLVPLFLALAYTLTTPFWAMVERAKERRSRRQKYWVPRSGSRVLRALATPLAVTDQAIIDPLRSLDSATADLLD